MVDHMHLLEVPTIHSDEVIVVSFGARKHRLEIGNFERSQKRNWTHLDWLFGLGNSLAGRLRCYSYARILPTYYKLLQCLFNGWGSCVKWYFWYKMTHGPRLHWMNSIRRYC